MHVLCKSIGIEYKVGEEEKKAIESSKKNKNA